MHLGVVVTLNKDRFQIADNSLKKDRNLTMLVIFQCCYLLFENKEAKH